MLSVAFNKYDYDKICSVTPNELIKWGLPTGQNSLDIQREMGIHVTLVNSAEGTRVRQYNTFHATVTDLLLAPTFPSSVNDAIERMWVAYQWRVLVAPYAFSAAGYRKNNKEDSPDIDMLVLSAEVMLSEQDNALWAHTAFALTPSTLNVLNIPYDTAGTVSRFLMFASGNLATRQTPTNPADVLTADLIRVGTCPPPPF